MGGVCFHPALMSFDIAEVLLCKLVVDNLWGHKNQQDVSKCTLLSMWVKNSSNMVGFGVTFVQNNFKIFLKESMNIICKEVIAKHFNMNK